jgi:CRP-like cAMP-binding protein
LSLPAKGILNCCPKRCACHERLIRNLLWAVSQKYFELQERLACLIQPTLRDKLLFYLKGVANKAGSHTFNIPFDRAALAEYLNAERSALSRELSAMKRDQLIDYYKNTFKLYCLF